MEPKIQTLQKKKLIGMRMSMSFVNDRIGELWRSFMPRRKEITNKFNDDLISLNLYEPGYFENFNPASEFERWAAVEVPDFGHIPDGMEKFTLDGGLYAIFHYKGLSTDNSIYQYIFGTWLPDSEYVLDDRPHFEVMGEKYKNNDPESEEEIHIPLRVK